MNNDESNDIVDIKDTSKEVSNNDGTKNNDKLEIEVDSCS